MRQVPDEQGPGRRSPVHATTLAAVRGQEMAAAAPGVTSGVETGRGGGTDRWQAVSSTWPPLAGR